MSGNGHATYFGQAVVSKGEGMQHESGTGLSDLAGTANTSSQTIPTGTTGGQSSTLSATRPGSCYSIPSTSVESSAVTSVFRTSLISKMDSLIQDFRMSKLSRSETLYQILQSLHDAGLEESIRQATLEEYTGYHDITATRQDRAER